MKIQKKIVTVIISLLTLALLGLVGIQTYLLNHASKLEEEIFRQNVNSALSSIVQKLETQEILTYIFKISNDSMKNANQKITIVHNDSTHKPIRVDSIFWRNHLPLQPSIQLDTECVDVDLLPKITTRKFKRDSSNFAISTFVNSRVISKPSLPIKTDSQKKNYFFKFTQDFRNFSVEISGKDSVLIVPDSVKNLNKRQIVEKVVDELSFIGKVSIDERLKLTNLDSIIKITLEEKGLNLDFAFGVVNMETDSMQLAQPKSAEDELRKSPYRTRLFPHDVMVEDNDLVLFFPKKSAYLFRKAGWSAGSALVFILVIIFCFVYVLRVIFKQKRFSRLLVDFINNMTHEFKTPISTISLTSETLSNPRILNDPGKLQQYGQIIRDESQRMRQQVEKILQMAALEEGDLELNLARVDVHDLIREAVEKFALKVQQRQGKIETDLTAVESIIHADAVHLSNIIHNLLDNALKYTKDSPEIRIRTENDGSSLKIMIQDNGIGISPADQKQVFEKYFRVPTGNVHDVKGFGLGLSYVKLIVEAHGGEVGVKSELGKGSMFEVRFAIESQ